MKIDEVTIQNILNTYGKGIGSKKNTALKKKEEISDKQTKNLELRAKDLNVVNYSKDGQIKLDSDKKQSLIDFFE